MLAKKFIALLFFILAVSFFFTLDHPRAEQDKAKLAQSAFAVFKQYCIECHGEDGKEKHTFLLEYKAMIEERKLVPGKPDESLVYQVIVSGKMPQDSEKLPDPDIATIKEWILAGAPDWKTEK